MHHYRRALPCAICLAIWLWYGAASAAAPGAEACPPLRRLCQAAGFVQAGASSGVGLRDDCMEPLLQGTAQPPNARLPLPAVDPSVLAQCRGNTSPPEPSAAESNAGGGLTLHYTAGSSRKITQLLGEEDKQLHQPTASRTRSRYGLEGTDLGYSFEHQGKLYFLFGDTVGVERGALDSIATLQTDDGGLTPRGSIRLDFLTSADGHYLTIQPPGIRMGAFEVPVAGISLHDQMYVVVSTDHSEDRSTDRSVLTRLSWPPTTTGFQPLRTIAQRPAGRFVKMSLHTAPEPIAGLPAGGPYVLMWGTSDYRHSDAYLAVVPEAQFETGTGTLYFSGLDAAGQPTWATSEAQATPIARNGTMGDLSVTWSLALKRWLMTYDSRPPAPAGVLFSYSSTPWGPWSQPQVIFNAVRDGALGRFIHDPDAHPADGLAGPVIGVAPGNAQERRGGAYAPYVIERWTALEGRQLSLYYVLSTWNPYVVMLMRSDFSVSGLGHAD
jgi:hypothetical protein